MNSWRRAAWAAVAIWAIIMFVVYWNNDHLTRIRFIKEFWWLYAATLPPLIGWLALCKAKTGPR